jgi:hypothetical protein
MSDQAPYGIEVTVTGGLNDADGEIVRAVVIGSEHEDEQQFIRKADETQESFQMRVRAAAAERSICWNGLPDMPGE